MNDNLKSEAKAVEKGGERMLFRLEHVLAATCLGAILALLIINHTEVAGWIRRICK